MGIMYWISLEAFAIRAKELGLDDEQASEMWARMSDPNCEESDKDRELLWGKDLELLGDYVDKAILNMRSKGREN